MKRDELESFLQQRQVAFQTKSIPYGVQIRCPGGEIFSCYDSGKLVVQGKRESELAQAVQAWDQSGFAPSAGGFEDEQLASRPLSKTVFIVYGHDRRARDDLELLLRRMSLEPIILGNMPAAGDTIIEKLERYLGEHGNVGFACVLLTPDDEGHPAGQPDRREYRARQNVILELGMVLARLGRRRVAILYKETVEQPSDIAGLIYLPFKEQVAEVSNRLFQELKSAGYDPNLESLA